MKKAQNIIFLCLLLAVIGYETWDKFFNERDLSSAYEHLRDVENFNIEVPDSFFFCQEKVPLIEPDIKERFDYELHKNVYYHSNTLLLLKKANRWLPQIEPILKKYKLPEDLKYLTLIESGLSNVISPAGAAGFWQLMPETAKGLGLEINEYVDERYDPIKSTHAACKYLKKAYPMFNDWTLTVAAYNRGANGMTRILKKQKVRSYYDLVLNNETKRYVFRALAVKQIFTNPEMYRFKLPKRNLYKKEKVKEIVVTEDIDNLVDFALAHDINYKLLKRFNPWLMKNSLKTQGKTYTILIPEETDFGDRHYSDLSELDRPTEDSVSTEEKKP